MAKNLSPKVSIIVPIYNVEQYLKQSIESITNQSLKDIEIICVNDGSTDNSYEILKNYAKLDQRIILLNQQNQGVSVARNEGIKRASADYIMFVDPDDWLELNAVEIAYKEIKTKGVDILNFGYFDYDNGNINSGYTSTFLDKYQKESIISQRELMTIQNVIWDKIYRKDFILNNKIQFPEKIKVAEDGFFNLQCMIEDARYGIINKSLYYYRMNRHGSAMANFDNVLVNEFNSLVKFVQSRSYKKASENLKILVLEKYIRGFLYNYERTKNNNNRLHIKQLNKIKKEIKKIIPEILLKKTYNYEELKDISFWKRIFQQLFSFKETRGENYTRNVLTILGIKLKFRKKYI